MRKYTPLDDSLYDYMVRQRSGTEDPVLDALRADTMKLGEVSQMAISLEQCSFLTLFVAAIGTKMAVEVGTFTGSSALSIARGLPDDGRLTCFDQADEWTAIAQRYWKKADVSGKIELRLGDAARLVPAFKPSKPLDFVFIDANKDGYDLYYESLLPHVRTGGVIIFDNMLRGGAVLHPVGEQTVETQAINKLNHKLAADTRVQSVLIPVADGLNICRKL